MQNFAGADTISVVNYGLMKRALFAVLGWLALSLPLAAQQPFDSASTFVFYRPEIFTSVDSAALVRELPMTEFLDGRLPGSSALGRMGTAPVANFPIALVSAQPRKKGTVSGPVKDPKDGKDYSSAESMAMEKASLSWTGGEIGIFYGHSASGKYSGDEFGSYIIGSVGNEHVQITAGAGYEESHFSRSRH